ncbi:MAG: sugar ABC transporter permease [Actinobacteria bacterium]|nr:sugar ABC transporter permease [Actinomycetota bacterium]
MQDVINTENSKKQDKKNNSKKEINNIQDISNKMTRPYTLIILPSIIVTILFLVPFIWGLYLSLTGYKLNNPSQLINWGLNYWKIIKTVRFWKSVVVTFEYTFFVVIIETTLGFFIANLLNTETIMAKIMRRIISLPLMIAPIIGTILLKLMLNNQFGIINYFLSFVGLGDFPWGASPNTSLFTVVLVDVWIFTPFIVLIILAGLKGLPKDPYEAASVDGARGKHILWNLTLPMIIPTALIAIIFRTIDSIKVFDIIFGMTGGGPGDSTTTFSVLGYVFTFSALDVAKGSTIMVITWIIVLLIGKKLVQYWESARSKLRA